MLAAPDQRTDQIVDGSGQRLKVSVVDPTRLDTARQILDRRHPIARRRRPPHRLDFDLPSVMLNDCDRLDAFDVSVDDLDGREPVGCGPASFGRSCPTRRRAPLRHPAADPNDDRPAAPATLQDLARRAGGLTSDRPIVRRLD